jgi:hypothetical protein
MEAEKAALGYREVRPTGWEREGRDCIEGGKAGFLKGWVGPCKVGREFGAARNARQAL